MAAVAEVQQHNDENMAVQEEVAHGPVPVEALMVSTALSMWCTVAEDAALSAVATLLSPHDTGNGHRGSRYQEAQGRRCVELQCS